MKYFMTRGIYKNQEANQKRIEHLKKIRVPHKITSGEGNLIKLRKKKEKCLFCNSAKNLQLHHIKPVIYDDKKRNFIDGDHSNNNIITLCSSCHQKLHYAQGDRKPNKLKDPKTGRFYKKYENKHQ